MAIDGDILSASFASYPLHSSAPTLWFGLFFPFGRGAGFDPDYGFFSIS